MKDALTIITTHVLDTLPDSVQKRKELLTAIGDVIGPRHRSGQTVRGLLAAMASVEELQFTLIKEFHQQ